MFKRMKNLINDMDKPLLIVTIIFVIFGLLNIVTASSREAVVNTGTSLYYFFWRQLLMLVISIAISIFIINVPTKRYGFWASVGFIAVFVMLVVLLFKDSHRGAQNWLGLFGGRVTIQPSEFAKPVIIVALSLIFEKYYNTLRNKNNNPYKIIGIILFVGLSMPAIIFLQKDFGTMFIISMIFGVMFLVSPILRKDKLKTIVFLVVVVFMAAMTLLATKGYIFSEEQLDRFNFFNPCSNYEEGGYQTCNGFIAINDGGLLGLGIGKSKQKYSYIPEPHTDSVFAIISEEYGFLKSGIIFIGYLFILKRILDLGSRANTLRGRYMCIGVATYIFMHILINLGGLFGVLPLTGVPLPFLSYGGSFLISLMCSLAVVQRVHIETKNQKIKIR